MTTPIFDKNASLETLCVHAGVSPEPVTGAIMTPIFQTSTYVQPAPGQPLLYDYSRAGNPTRTALEDALAALEGGRIAITFPSGLSAAQAMAQLLNPGDHVLVCDDVYGGTGRLFRRVFAKYGITFDFIDMTSLPTVQEHLTSQTKLIWMETPTNPLLKVIDIQAVCEMAHKTNALCLVDNTFASPIFQQPLALGADFVLHSSTKYLGGHSDLVGGAVITNHTEFGEQLKFLQFATGVVNAPFEAFLLLRSLKTLAIRMKKHHENALKVAHALREIPQFTEVIFPGLESHPQHSLACRQMSGFSGMISARVKGSFDDVKALLSRLKIFALAESLGGVESLVNHPETMTHASVPVDFRTKLGITHDLLRFSVGIENAEDLIGDLQQAGG